MKLIKTIILAAAFVVAAAPAGAQNLPGYRNDFDASRLQFRAYAMEGFHKVLGPWTDAARSGDLDSAMSFYTDDAFVFFDGVGQGTREVRARLAEWLASVDDLRLGIRDFDASGSISYASVHMVVNSSNPEDDGDGTMVFVLRRQGRSWKIRSQTIVMN